MHNAKQKNNFKKLDYFYAYQVIKCINPNGKEPLKDGQTNLEPVRVSTIRNYILSRKNVNI